MNENFMKFMRTSLIVFADSLRTQRRNINNVENFASFQRGDPSPMFEIIFREDGNTRLHFLRADFITTLNNVKATVTVLKGDNIIDSRVGLAICNLISYLFILHPFVLPNLPMFYTINLAVRQLFFSMKHQLE